MDVKTVYPPQTKFAGGIPQTKFAGGIKMKILEKPKDVGTLCILMDSWDSPLTGVSGANVFHHPGQS